MVKGIIEILLQIGSTDEEYSNFSNVAITLFSSALGKFHFKDGFKSKEFLISKALLMMFVMTSMFIVVNLFITLLNIFLSILKDDDSIIPKDHDVIDYLFAQMKAFISQNHKEEANGKKGK